MSAQITSTTETSADKFKNDSTENDVNEGAIIKYPRKRFYRQRAHSNPFSIRDLVFPDSPDRLLSFREFFFLNTQFV